jgi:hypothetical protein
MRRSGARFKVQGSRFKVQGSRFKEMLHHAGDRQNDKREM